MSNLEVTDIQGIIIRSYGTRPSARFYFLEIKDVKKTRKWIGKIKDEITHGKHKSEEERENDQGEPYINIAFTRKGLKKLGVKTKKETHNQSFDLGPLNRHTKRMLGDVGKNAPKHWEWGNKKEQKKIHILLMVYAVDQGGLELTCKDVSKRFDHAELKVVNQFESNLNKDGKEHLGYVDGISQPMIEGIKERGEVFPENTVKAGEFVLGYPNEYKRYPESPKVKEKHDPENILKESPDPDPEYKGYKDLGMNGSYLVFRQLSEDVKKFWDYVQKYVDSNPNGPGEKGVEYVAAKMFGRWTNGSALALHPEKPKEGIDKENKFFYHQDDLEGLKCPIGSHARRANPRDDFEQKPNKKPEQNRDDSIAFSKKHRIIRRARPYGKPLVESMNVKEIIAAPDDKVKRGIYFIVVNADYGRQFEFVQQTWMASPEFRELYSDPDPLMGSQENVMHDIDSHFTIQDTPVRQRMPKLKTFVYTKGSAYFFMPGIHALEYIARGY